MGALGPEGFRPRNLSARSNAALRGIHPAGRTRPIAKIAGTDAARKAIPGGSAVDFRTGRPAGQGRTQSDTMDALCEEGRTGVMAGNGFLDRGDRSPAELFRDRDRRLLALKKAMKEVGRMEGR